MTRQIPMLFSPAMVEALLAGRKTETRRIIHGVGDDGRIYIKKSKTSGLDGLLNVHDAAKRGDLRCAPGDLIWVKEAHYAFGWWETTDELTKKTQKPKRQFVRYPAKPVLFEAPADVMTGQPEQQSGWYNRSSLFLPKADSRLTLPVTGFNIEQLHDISSKSCLAEGVHPIQEVLQSISDAHSEKHRRDEYHRAHVAAYQSLWNSINGADAWHANPWVDVTKFEVLQQNVTRVSP